jgi:hypothetical protein
MLLLVRQKEMRSMTSTLCHEGMNHQEMHHGLVLANIFKNMDLKTTAR